MKDHEKRELVNALTAIARDFGHTQQLRERIAHCVLPALERLDSANLGLWKRTLQDYAAVHWCLTKENENDPKKLLDALLDVNAKWALDPAISQDARDLIKKGREGCTPGSTQQCLG